MNYHEELIESLNQAAEWIKENKNEPINELEELEIIFENKDGFEISVSRDFLELVKELQKEFLTLKQFIKQNLDPTKCYDQGVPL